MFAVMQSRGKKIMLAKVILDKLNIKGIPPRNSEIGEMLNKIAKKILFIFQSEI